MPWSRVLALPLGGRGFPHLGQHERGSGFALLVKRLAARAEEPNPLRIVLRVEIGRIVGVGLAIDLCASLRPELAAIPFSACAAAREHVTRQRVAEQPAGCHVAWEMHAR